MVWFVVVDLLILGGDGPRVGPAVTIVNLESCDVSGAVSCHWVRCGLLFNYGHKVGRLARDL